MKNLTNFIQEKYLIDKNTIVKNDPEIGETAYDYNDDPWIILDFCKFKDKAALKKLLKKYDDSGCFGDFVNDEYIEITPDDYVVAAELDDENADSRHSQTAVWIWGSDGLSYKNND